MADNQSIKIPAHPNIYNRFSNRELRIDFSTPFKGVNEETGLILFVPGFGGNIESNIYKKMRDIFADKFNLVTIQCSFFGDEYMQSADNFTLENTEYYINKYLTAHQKCEVSKDPTLLLNVLSKETLLLPVKAKILETPDVFNDMGFMQAIDLITCIEAMKIIIRENKLNFNEQKVIGYGHSHGAYLLHLVNRMSPNLLTNIIDNSGWIEPVYLSANRNLYQSVGKMTLQIEFEYLAKQLVTDKEALNLKTLYKDYQNQANIIVFQGTDDNLIDHQEKQRIISTIANTNFKLIDENDVDEVIFKSNKHGLDADFIKLFEHAYSQLDKPLQKEKITQSLEISLSKTKLSVDYSQGLPIFTLQSQNK